MRDMHLADEDDFGLLASSSLAKEELVPSNMAEGWSVDLPV